jgi:hypothetical protein|tara:strand:- start:456 stop:695 length:240 start_codon:yes stop_codon:yes gene_type:complete
MYRIVRETNFLTDKIQFFIEEYKGFFFKSWTRNLDLGGNMEGPFGASTYDGAKWKMDQIILKKGRMILKEVIVKKYEHR